MAATCRRRGTLGPGIDEPLGPDADGAGLNSGRTAVLASTPDGLRGPRWWMMGLR